MPDPNQTTGKYQPPDVVTISVGEEKWIVTVTAPPQVFSEREYRVMLEYLGGDNV